VAELASRPAIGAFHPYDVRRLDNRWRSSIPAMAFPTQREIEIPLLHALVDPCGEARPIDIYTAVAAGFPDLTAEDQRQRLEPGAVK
jgi:hypothetical protein